MVRYFVLAAFLASQAQAASVFLNGTNIDGVVNQVYQNCTVTIDAQGNILIVSKSYGAVPSPSPVTPPEPAGPSVKSSEHVWLVTEKAAPGMAQYDVDLFVNGKWVRKFLDDEEHVVMELSKHLQPGLNKIIFMAKKNLGSNRRSASPQHYSRIVVGEGESSGRNVMINRKLIDYKRTALETKDFRDEFTVTVQP